MPSASEKESQNKMPKITKSKTEELLEKMILLKGSVSKLGRGDQVVKNMDGSVKGGYSLTLQSYILQKEALFNKVMDQDILTYFQPLNAALNKLGTTNPIEFSRDEALEKLNEAIKLLQDKVNTSAAQDIITREVEKTYEKSKVIPTKIKTFLGNIEKCENMNAISQEVNSFMQSNPEYKELLGKITNDLKTNEIGYLNQNELDESKETPLEKTHRLIAQDRIDYETRVFFNEKKLELPTEILTFLSNIKEYRNINAISQEVNSFMHSNPKHKELLEKISDSLKSLEKEFCDEADVGVNPLEEDSSPRPGF